MDLNQLDLQLRETFADLSLSKTERDNLRNLVATLSPEHISFLRNKAFDIARSHLHDGYNQEKALTTLKWLEQVVKTCDKIHDTKQIEASAHFTPGESCRAKIISLCKYAQSAIDVCVFTISDDQLSEALIDAHKRNIAVRIITDNEKQFDIGSDIEMLQKAGIPLRTDKSEYHMHHKFALFDQKILLNGSFNWTRSASSKNAENILTTDNPLLVSHYLAQFEKLWTQYEDAQE